MRSRIYLYLANVVLAIHLLVVLLLFSGAGGIILMFMGTGPFVQFPVLYRLTLALVATTCLTQVVFMSCPLTVLEFRLRAQSDSRFKFQRSFIEYYADKWLGIRIPAWLMSMGLSMFLLTVLMMSIVILQ